ncbi:MAG: transketolase, partial [Verrucomicrobia bacterium]|nr:transketolase [Verrucomicrobiota bacterium]
MMPNEMTIADPSWRNLYRAMRMARKIEELATDLARRGDASFHLGGDGHEGMAALALLLGPQDWLHPHYRDVALILARGLPASAYIHALLGTAAGPTGGRDMPPFQCDRRLHLLGMATLVGNSALQAAGVAAHVRDLPDRPVVYCGMGDGGSQQGEVYEAVAEAVRSRLPVLFAIEDNRFALSTPTAGRTFYDLPGGPAGTLLGVPILHVDGRDPRLVAAALGPLVAAMREDRAPRIAVVHCERLLSHSNSDDQTVYRPPAELSRIRAEADPMAVLRRHLEAAGAGPDFFRATDESVDAELTAALSDARTAPRPVAAPARRPLPEGADLRSRECRGADTGRTLSMLEAMRETLRHFLQTDPSVTLSGQDIADPKGDVFGVTRGLSTAFPGRVTNAPLTESTIVGTAIGRALVGGRPVAFLQFADFFPPAYNQIAAELATIHWRTNGQFETPVIVMAVTGGYRPGLGPYHAQSPEAAMAIVPGLDVVAPSTAADAAGLLMAAFESRRPTIFLYPKALLNERRLATSPDVGAQFAPIGRARLVRTGRDLTLVGWANTVGICERSADELARAGVEAEVIDLRSISPWDRDLIVASAARTGRLIVVHEAAPFCGVGAEILAAVA